ncbi:DUF222 domain-containing protein [Pseudomonadota bacterium]
MSQIALPPSEASHLEQARRRQTHCRQLENQITELAAHIHAATYRLLELIREYDESEGWCGPGLNSCAHWLNWRCGINLGAAREKVRVAHALKTLPKISDRFRQGEISYSKVRALTRVATAENEDYLLNIARHGTAAHVERLVRNYRKVKRSEALERDNERHVLRQLDCYFDDDETFVLKGRFTPEQGVLVKKVLELIMDEDFQEQLNVSAETPVDELKDRSEPVSQRRADALVRMAEGYLSGAGHKDHGGDRYLVHVHTDLETLKADGTGAESEIEEGRNVSAETSRRLSCDAGVVHWQETKKGKPLSVGRKTRTIPPAIRRALQRRDNGCQFPGCSCSRFVHAHHIRHWADGGETSLGNLALLCSRHHRMVHEDGFGVHTQADGQIWFSDPQGRRLPETGDTGFSGNVFSLMTANTRSGIHITPQTGECRWEGEQMDDDLAILCMLQLE